MRYKKELQIGFLFIVGLVLLFVFSITISKLKIFNHVYNYMVFFKSIGGLKTGDPVRVSGMEVGTVESLKLLPNTEIKVVLKSNIEIPLYKDYKITIEEASSLGGNLVAIKQGTPSLGKITTEEYKGLRGTIAASGINKLGEFVENNQDDVKDALQKLKTLINDLSAGKGTIGKLITDDTLYNNLTEASESIKKVAKQLEEGKGTLGKLLFDEKLSGQLSSAGDAAEKVIAPVMKTQVFLNTETKYFAESESIVSKINLTIHPHEKRYFLAGGAFMALDKDGVVDFENKLTKDKDQTFVKAEVQLAYKYSWADHKITFRPGFIEGKAGAGIDWDIPREATGIVPLHITFEGRDAYNSVEDEDIDENVRGGMFRIYATANIWKHFKLYAGANRLFNDDVEFMGGACFSYNDADIKNFIVLIGLSAP
ncbi:MAG: MCE family protein [Planctomycetes bacterium]|nr:MCE family protein [Planctomycetota bacterium]